MKRPSQKCQNKSTRVLINFHMAFKVLQIGQQLFDKTPKKGKILATHILIPILVPNDSE